MNTPKQNTKAPDPGQKMTRRRRFLCALAMKGLQTVLLLGLFAMTVNQLKAATGELTFINSYRLVNAGRIVISPDGKHLYAASVGSYNWGIITAYNRDLITGTLSAVDSETKHSGMSGTGSLAVSPDGKYVYFGAITGQRVLSFQRDSSTGDLTYMATADTKFGFGGSQNVNSIQISPDGENLYTTGAGRLGVYDLDPITGSLTELQGVQGNNIISASNRSRVSPDGRHLYLSDINGNAIVIWDRDLTNGTVSNVRRFENGTGGALIDGPNDIQISPDGEYLYVGIVRSDDSLTTLKRDLTTGDLTFASSIPFGADRNPREMFISPDGSILLASLQTGARIQTYARDTTTGALSLADEELNNNGGNKLSRPSGVTISPDGLFAYAGSSRDGYINAYALEAPAPNQAPDCTFASIADQIADGNCQATISGADVFGITDPENDALTITVSPSILTAGSNIVTVTADDGNGNTCSTDLVVNVLDTQAPIAIAQDITVQLDAITGLSSVSGLDIDNGSFDNCGGIVLSISQASFSSNDLGANAVTLTVTDSSGNSSTAFATVTVESIPVSERVYWIETEKVQSINKDGTGAIDLLVSGLGIGFSIEVDEVGGKIYWSDRTTFKISRSDLDGSNVEDLYVLSAADRPFTITLDVAAGDLYYASPDSKTIKRAKMDGSQAPVVIYGQNDASAAPNQTKNPGIRDVRGMALDIEAGMIYWTDRGTGDDRVVRGSMDGSMIPQLLYTQASGSAQGIALDIEAGMLYWANSGRGQIERAKMDGSGSRESLYTGGTGSGGGPTGVVLDIEAGDLYWTSASADDIRRGKMEGPNVQDGTPVTIASGLNNPWDVALGSSGGGGTPPADDGIVIISGYNGTMLRSEDAGLTWEDQNTGISDHLMATSFVDSETGWAVGNSFTTIHTTDGGDTYTEQTQDGFTNTIQDVFFLDTNQGWAVGRFGQMSRTSDGGSTWTAMTPPYTIEEANGLHCVFFADSLNGWAGSYTGAIWHTNDGGDTWVEQGAGVLNNRHLNELLFLDTNQGWAVDGSGGIYNTTDGGTTWIAQNSGSTRSLRAVTFIDSNTGWVVGDSGTILKTSDGGSNWSSLTSGTSNNLFGVAFPDASNGWAVGANGTILRTADGGTNWDPQGNSSEYLSDVATIGTFPQGVDEAPTITLLGNNPLLVECGDLYTDPGASALDDIDGDLSGSIVVDSNSVNTAATGIYTVTYNVTDSGGNAATEVTRTVEVIDTTAPSITLNGASSITLECSLDTYIEDGAIATDSCDTNVTVVIGGDIVDVNTLGTYVVTYNATDASGNVAAQVTRTVIVSDTTAPVITLTGAASITLECALDSYFESGVVAADACDPNVAVVVGGDVVDINTLGTYVVTYNATDASGNVAAQVTRTVIVSDTTAPVITLTGASSITLECVLDAYTESGAVAADACDPNVAVVVGGDVVDVNNLGTYVVTYNATDASGNVAAQVTRTVIVSDTTAPVITLTGAASVTLECVLDSYTESGAVAADVCDPNVTVVVGGDVVDVNNLGTYVVTYNATDASGNVAAQVTRTVIVEDTTAPVISLNGDAAITLECHVGSYTEQGAVALDSCDANVSVVIGGDTVDSNSVGTYVVIYNAVDSSGNAAVEVKRTITVQDITPPVITLIGSNTVIIECPGIYVEEGATADDLCGGDLTGDISIDSSEVDAEIPGSYQVVYTVVDASGNTTIKTRHVEVVDTIAPVISLNGAADVILYQNDPYVELGANASDACDLNVSIEIGGDAVDTSVIDIYAVTYNAADASGNVASTKVRTVTVLPRFAALDALFGCVEVKLENQATVNGSLASNYQVDLHDASQVTGDVISVAGQAQLKKNASVAGHVDAGRKVTLHNNAVVGLSVISGEKIDLKKNAQIGGDATSAGEVKLAAGAVVNGLISEDQIVEALDDIPLPILSIATSGSNITVKKNKSAAIAPGSYQRLNAKENSLVELVGGHYTFSEIKVGKRSEILLDVSTGPITIDVSGNALFEGVDMLIWGGDASDVLFQIQGDEAKLGSHAQKKNTNHMGTYTGTFLVPNGQVMLESKATLTGSTYAQSVLLKNESVLNSAPALDLLIGASVNWLGMEACLPQVEKSASKSASQSKSKSISIREKSTSESTSKKKEKSKSKKKR